MSSTNYPQDRSTKMKSAFTAAIASALAMLTTGCSTKNYVRSQTTPLIQQTNELDTKTAPTIATSWTPTSARKAGIANARLRRTLPTSMRWQPDSRPMRRISPRRRPTTASTA